MKGSMSGIVYFLQEAFLEWVDLTVTFSFLFFFFPTFSFFLCFFFQNIIWADGKLPSSEERVCLSEP